MIGIQKAQVLALPILEGIAIHHRQWADRGRSRIHADDVGIEEWLVRPSDDRLRMPDEDAGEVPQLNILISKFPGFFLERPVPMVASRIGLGIDGMVEVEPSMKEKALLFIDEIAEAPLLKEAMMPFLELGASLVGFDRSCTTLSVPSEEFHFPDRPFHPLHRPDIVIAERIDEIPEIEQSFESFGRFGPSVTHIPQADQPVLLRIDPRAFTDLPKAQVSTMDIADHELPSHGERR